MKKEIHIHLHINSLVDTIEVKTETGEKGIKTTETVQDIKEELLEALARLVNEDTMTQH